MAANLNEPSQPRLEECCAQAVREHGDGPKIGR